MQLALILFAVAAAGGAALLAIRVRTEKLPPMAIALVHGGVAAAALVALALPVIGGEGDTKTTIALGLFVAAALGGFTLFAAHLRGQTFGVPLALGHGLLAVVAFVILLLAVL